MKFAARSLLVLFALYGLVFAIGDAYLMRGGAPWWWGIGFVLAFTGVQYLLSPWLIETFFSIGWYEEDIPASNRQFVEQLCAKQGLPPIRLGVIESGTPNAFAFGRLRRDARIVVTRGLLDVLSEDEINAVLAHEIGHVAHYDFVVMALAAMAPLMLWQIYIWTDRINNLRVVSYAAYVAYWLGQYLVLLLNRTREYGADHFSATVTNQPSALASALVKIAYGMVRERSRHEQSMAEGSKDRKKDAKKDLQFGYSLALMGIASASAGSALALYTNSPEEAARVMRWDLSNPWARFYVLGSTHPLTAMRLRALNQFAREQRQDVTYPLPEDVRVRWRGFPVELFFWAAPLVCGFVLLSWFWIGRPLLHAGFSVPLQFVPWLTVALGVTWAARIAFRYRGSYAPKNVADLLEDMEVSQMRPRAVQLEGTVIGHGIPGALWSADLVLQDETGMMFLLYRSSVPLGRLLFAFRSADRLIGERVTVQGWYRRGLKPYVEIARVEARIAKARESKGPMTLFGGDTSSPVEYEPLVERSYSRWIQLVLAAACTAVGVIWLVSM